MAESTIVPRHDKHIRWDHRWHIQGLLSSHRSRWHRRHRSHLRPCSPLRPFRYRARLRPLPAVPHTAVPLRRPRISRRLRNQPVRVSRRHDNARGCRWQGTTGGQPAFRQVRSRRAMTRNAAHQTPSSNRTPADCSRSLRPARLQDTMLRCRRGTFVGRPWADNRCSDRSGPLDGPSSALRKGTPLWRFRQHHRSGTGRHPENRCRARPGRPPRLRHRTLKRNGRSGRQLWSNTRHTRCSHPAQ